MLFIDRVPIDLYRIPSQSNLHGARTNVEHVRLCNDAAMFLHYSAISDTTIRCRSWLIIWSFIHAHGRAVPPARRYVPRSSILHFPRATQHTGAKPLQTPLARLRRLAEVWQ